MKTYQFLIIVLVCCFCNGFSETQTSDTENFPKQEKYELIRDNLYMDKSGNLYFKTYDHSNKDSLKIRYIDVVYSEKFGKDGIKKIKDVVDKDSFRYDPKSKLYKDKNHTYIFKAMADGGTLSIKE